MKKFTISTRTLPKKSKIWRILEKGRQKSRKSRRKSYKFEELAYFQERPNQGYLCLSSRTRGSRRSSGSSPTTKGSESTSSPSPSMRRFWSDPCPPWTDPAPREDFCWSGSAFSWRPESPCSRKMCWFVRTFQAGRTSFDSLSCCSASGRRGMAACPSFLRWSVEAGSWISGRWSN